MEIFDGHQVVRLITQEFSLRLVIVGSLTYIGKAKPGANETDAVWQIKRLDETSGLIIKFADGDDKFNNIWNNYAALTYL